jgi:mono/diheme cytochrome c family protein
MGRRGILLLALAVMGSAAGAAWAAEQPAAADRPATAPAAADVAFFESRIRPVLVAHCLECHSADAKEPGGGLALDRAAGWQRGGDSGPAIVPGDSAASLLMAALRYESLEMPPAGRLPDAVVADFARWIDQGAADPRDESMPEELARTSDWVIDGAIDWEAARAFWSFQPPRHAPPPMVADTSWPRESIDRFVLAALEQKGLRPSADAPPAALLRRVAFDLTGLPPSPDLVAAFVADPSPAHLARIVDEMLVSRAAAEHQARHWLDVARYADSNGSDFNATFHDAWRYRDFVIRACADDMPFDQFVVRQIAGDLLEAADDDEAADNLVATGFLMVGTKMLSERDKAKLEMDVVDDMIDTCGRAFLGLTLGCARCHDHKFDPVPTEDYYALAGIFRSTQVLDGESQKYVSTWVKRPLPVEPEHAESVARYEARHKETTGALKAARTRRDGEKAAAVAAAGAIVFDDAQATREGTWQASTYTRPFHAAGYVHDGNRDKGSCRIVFPGPSKAGTYRVRIAYTPGSNRASNVPVEVVLDQNTRHAFVVDQRRAPGVAPFWHDLGEFHCTDPEATKVVIANAGTDGYVLADAVAYVAVGGAPDRPADEVEAEEARQARLAAAEAEVKRIEAEIASLEADKPPPLPMAMAVREAKHIGDAFVCVRGEVDNRGPEVPRGFLRICSAGPAQLPADRSGRMELARWLTDPDNPLAARVIVNRMWMHLFGEGLVRTVDNFGMQGERPTHPELLDTLAVEFVRDGWSIRRLVRRLVLTRAYAQSSASPAPAAAGAADPLLVDPENRLLWRAHRKRVPAEALRDTLLVAAGILDSSPSVAPLAGFGTLVTQNVATPGDVKVEATTRRSIYLPVIRGMVHPLLVTFDFADPDLIVGRRESTNVPAQALTLLNNPEVITWCTRIAERIMSTAQDDDARVRLAYRLLVQREPDAEEAAWVTAYVRADRAGDAESAAGVGRWTRAVQALVASTEFRFVD